MPTVKVLADTPDVPDAPAVAPRIAYAVPSRIIALPLAVTLVRSPEAAASAIDFAASSGFRLKTFAVTSAVDWVPLPLAAPSWHQLLTMKTQNTTLQAQSIPSEPPVPEAAISALSEMMAESAVDFPAAPAATESTTAVPVP